MIDYKNELGPLLTKVLKIIKESAEPISRDELARVMKVSNRIATDYLEALYSRGYIMDYRGDWRDKKTKEPIFEITASRWIVSVAALIILTCIIIGGRGFGFGQSSAR